MAREPSLDEVRRHFAEELRVVSHIGSERLVEAFAAVPRERFAGPGPWRLLHDGDGYWSTPDANPHWLYHNVLVALDEKRRLNIGGPSLWAFHFDRIGVRQGERVLQLGAGSGYYTAILAELAGPRGRIDALEIDEDLAESGAAQSRRFGPPCGFAAPMPALPIEGQWDVIVAFAGAAAPARLVARRAGRRRTPAAADDDRAARRLHAAARSPRREARGPLGRMGRLLPLRRRAQRGGSGSARPGAE